MSLVTDLPQNPLSPLGAQNLLAPSQRRNFPSRIYYYFLLSATPRLETVNHFGGIRQYLVSKDARSEDAIEGER